MKPEIYIEARGFLIGDSYWRYSWIRHYADSGYQVVMVVDPYNRGVFEFLRDYCVGCQDLLIVEDPGSHPLVSGGEFWSPGLHHPTTHQSYWGEFQELELRRIPEPIVDPLSNGSYLVAQPESVRSRKFSKSLMELKITGRVFSLCYGEERAIPGSIVWRNCKTEDAVRLIYHSQGVFGVWSSFLLLGAILGRKTVTTGWDGLCYGRRFSPGDEGGFTQRRRLVEVGGRDQLKMVIDNHLGAGFVN